MNEYQKMIKESMKNRDSLTRKQYKQIKNLYKEAAKDLKIKSDKARKGSLTERWAKDYRKAVKSEIKQVNKILFKQILDNIVKSANLAAGIQLNFFNLVDKKYKLNMSKSFTNMFSKVPNDVVEELIKGNIYKDGRGLSKRIWWTGNKVNGDIDKIIQKGIVEKKSAIELAQDLQTYVNPDMQKEWNWKKVYPGTSKTVDYNAQRLARTSISHAYTLALLRSCERNPFITKIRWHSVFAPGRTCALCRDRDGQEYLLADCPLDHPNGLCYQEPLLDYDLAEIGSRLGDWVSGSNDSMLDKWFNKYGDYFD
ncbi:phage head morphogenesis protein [Clostridium tyrobutyricum]|uniref:phage head morphogenesis protein n=1 Tax=Clostridium tyrobutyricum TaxID=1519 RepID=UPI001C38455C|nr:phage head morphogenesis protein [Clostridium tyrobutyricum]MBV4441142.1 phage head morphogenesis protein [Clostridium tyrobutyricum]